MASSHHNVKGMTLFTRSDILTRLKVAVSSGTPILAAGTSAGLIAKSAAEGGADLLVVYSTGISRLKGLPTSRIGDSNLNTIAMVEEILNVVEDVPVIGGVEAWDPTHMRLQRLLTKFEDAGFSGVINYPTISTMGETWRNRRERVGLGFSREVELIGLAHDRDIFTMAYVATEDDATRMARAGVDVLVPHVGATAGGRVGHETGRTLDDDIADLNAMIGAAQRERDDIIYLAHGGKLSEPADLPLVYERTACVGFVGASSVERIPIERAVHDVVAAFKSHTLPVR